MLRIIKTRKLLIGVAILLLIGGAVLLFVRQNKITPLSVLESEQVMEDLAKGSCSDETKAKLLVASTNSDTELRARVLENQGLCYVYAGDYTGALESYRQSKDAYSDAGLSTDSARMEGAISGVRAGTADELREAPPAGLEVVGGT